MEIEYLLLRQRFRAAIGDPLDALPGSRFGHFANSFIFVMYCVALWPLVLRLTEGKKEARAEKQPQI